MKPIRFSRLTTWALRVLLVIVAVMAASLFMLSMLGGTSETHRHGLQQAFSDIFKADIKIGRVDEFNILPQLSVRTSNVQGKFRSSGNEFMADKFDVAFGFMDLMAKRSKIENFNLVNFRFAADAAYDLHIDKAAMVPGKDAFFKAEGNLDKRDFHVSLPMSQVQGPRISYFFPPQARLAAELGSLSIATGPHKTANEAGALKDLAISYQGHVIATGGGSSNGKGVYKISFKCTRQDLNEDARADMNILRALPFIAMNDCPE